MSNKTILTLANSVVNESLSLDDVFKRVSISDYTTVTKLIESGAASDAVRYNNNDKKIQQMNSESVKEAFPNLTAKAG